MAHPNSFGARATRGAWAKNAGNAMKDSGETGIVPV